MQKGSDIGAVFKRLSTAAGLIEQKANSLTMSISVTFLPAQLTLVPDLELPFTSTFQSS
jgi:hypothetical protein